MTIHNTFALLLALAAGLGLGAVFFGGLWWTVRNGLHSRQPAVWFMGSFLLRMGIALGGFYLVGWGHWERLIACLLGFVMARIVVHAWTSPSPPPSEANDAP
jgi:F1F0 ATPase subunit 2